MNTLVTRRSLLLALTATAVFPSPVFRDEVCPASRVPRDDARGDAAAQAKGLLGRWRSTRLRPCLLLEWGDASRCELIICEQAQLSAKEKLELGRLEDISGMATFPDSTYVILLYLSNGRERWLAPDTTPGWLASDRTLRLGPLGSHLVFAYRLDGDLLKLVRGRHRPLDDTADRDDIILERYPAG